MAIKPGTPHPTRKGLVMGKNGSYVSKTTYAKQVKAANAPKEPVTKPVTRSGPVKGPVPKNNSAVRLPNSSRAGVNLPRAGASAERMYASSQKPKPAAKPTASKPNLYTSGKPNPNAGGGVKGGAPKSGSLAQRAAAASKVRKGGRIAAGLGVGSYIASKLAEAADPKTWEKKSKELQKRYGSKPSAKPKAKATDKETAALTKPGGLFYRGDGKPKAEKPKPARQNVTPSKPRVKAQTKPPVGKKPAKPQTSGVGPVASGRTYSVQKTGKSVMQQQADELRAMRKASQERQEADKKKKRKYSR